MTKQLKLQRNIDRMASLFDIPSLPARIGTAGRMIDGKYFPEWIGTLHKKGQITLNHQIAAHILIDHKLTFANSLETQAHEFAHHLDYLEGLGIIEPPQHLPEVREAIAKGMSRTELSHSALDRVDASWHK